MTGVNPVKRLYVVPHRDPAVARSSIGDLIDAARQHEVDLVCAPGEAIHHPLLAAAALDGELTSCDAAMVLAGDGTLVRIARLAAGIPVLGVNFGMLGYLSGASHDQIAEAVQRLARGDVHVESLRGLVAELPGGGGGAGRDQPSAACGALNDIVATGGVTGRVVEVAWRIVRPGDDGSANAVDDMGAVACDGMVISTPVGSTAYNLSNGGPVMAWGVAGAVVSFIAPHTLAARPLVIAPGHAIELEHLGRGGALTVLADGSDIARMQPHDVLRVSQQPDAARLAFVDDTSFYARYRDNFATPMLFSGPRVRRSQRHEGHAS